VVCPTRVPWAFQADIVRLLGPRRDGGALFEWAACRPDRTVVYVGLGVRFTSQVDV